MPVAGAASSPPAVPAPPGDLGRRGDGLGTVEKPSGRPGPASDERCVDVSSSSGARPHWEVSESLELPWLEDAYIESARLMRVFMDAPVDELLINRGSPTP